MEGLEILLERDNNGCYTAIVELGDIALEVTRRYGSWTTVPDDNGRFRDLIAPIPAELQKRVQQLERAN